MCRSEFVSPRCSSEFVSLKRFISLSHRNVIVGFVFLGYLYCAFVSLPELFAPLAAMLRVYLVEELFLSCLALKC